MSLGKVDIRFTPRTGKHRLRFYGVAPDQLETIQAALEKARKGMGTTFDAVALEMICLQYLSDE